MSRALILLSLLFALGCGGSDSTSAPAGDGSGEAAEVPNADEPPPAPPGEGDPELDTIIALAAKIRANPDSAAGLLADAGYTLAGFSELLIEVASDPTRSKAYAAAN